ncbi:MAG: hypothetical protein ACE5EY_16105 [Anaerolineae bacterium]
MIVLAVTYYDPDGRLYPMMQTAVPLLTNLFDGFVVNASDVSYQPTLALFRAHGAIVNRRPNETPAQIGKYRREAVAQAVAMGADFVMLNDGDRAAHWVRHYADELAQAAQFMQQYDFTVLGRTARAFASHPVVQTETEKLANRLFATVSGHAWDVLAAGRGLSRRAAEAVVARSDDGTVGVDTSWPLLLIQLGGFSFGYLETEGLEFETADQFPEAVAAAGGTAAWKAQLDADPKHWLFRLQAAHIEIESMLPYCRNESGK